MKNKLKLAVTVVCVSVFLFGMSGWFMLKAPSEYSVFERRELEKLPEFDIENILSGKFMKEFEANAPDQMPLRDTLRSIKAYASKYLFFNKENNGLYYADGQLSLIEYPENGDSLDYAAQRVNYLYEKFVKNTSASSFVCVIPDKNRFLAEENGYLSLDYEAFAKEFFQKTGVENYIDITGFLSADDYYSTDTHWRQECITDVAEYITEALGAEFVGEFTQKTLEKPFYGVLYGQSALRVEPDTINYLTTDTLKNCTVLSYATLSPVEIPLYSAKKADGNDPYEMFLNGSEPVLTITNPAADGKNEIIIFRDSFSSSLAPLLAQSFSKITLIDTRYVQPSVLDPLSEKGYIDFNSADSVLFIYSTVLLNDAFAMNKEM